MTTQFLQTFLQVYRLGSQRKAGEHLSLSQPAVCQHIQKLEHVIGRPLFVRHGRRLAPTPTAHLLALKIGVHLDSLETLLNQLSLEQLGEWQPIYLCGPLPLLARVCMPSLKPLLERNLQFHLISNETDPVGALLEDRMDLAIITEPISHPNLTIEPLMEEIFLLVGHASFMERFPDGVSTKKIKQIALDLPWIVLEETIPLIKEYFQTVFEISFSGVPVMYVDNLWALEEGVAAGLGVSVLPSYFCHHALVAGKMVPLISTDYPVLHQFYLAWRTEALNRQSIAITREILLQSVAQFYEQSAG